ncbi:unnamed protein product [Pocillopora meandrina]|uniref:Uncharacterized protein n=1 Tax=Pocillopora meandrina TaxID=46732 RepID=A0AAU9XU98_9CNID|nr:unnamed protein product [Pocillopora meandrina]
MSKLKLWCKRRYSDLVTRSRNVGILLIYYTNLWRYNSQKALEAFLHGQPQQQAPVPFMITRKMRKSLASLGYTEQDIDRMTPSEASDKVSCGVQNSSQASGTKQVKTEDQSRDVK